MAQTVVVVEPNGAMKKRKVTNLSEQHVVVRYQGEILDTPLNLIM